MNIFEIKNTACLISANSNNLLTNLEDVFEQKTKNPLDIVLLQSESVEDYSDSWKNELIDKIFHSELYHRVHRFRSLLRKIRASSHNWHYIAQNNCLGSYWDLALACKYRYWIANNSLMGFPGIKFDTYPLGSDLIDFKISDSNKTNLNFSDPVKSLVDSHLSSWINFKAGNTSNTPLSLEKLKPLLEKITASNKEMLQKKVKDFSLTEEDQNTQALRWEKAKELHQEWTQSKKNRTNSSDINYINQLSKSRLWFKNLEEHESLISFSISKNLLSRQISEFSSAKFLKPNASELLQEKRKIYVDINMVSPPNKIITQLLNRHYCVVFCSKDYVTLNSYLQRLHHYLNKKKSLINVQQTWSRQISWFLGVLNDSHQMKISFLFDETVEISYNNSLATFSITETHRHGDTLYLWELKNATQPLKNEVVELLGQLKSEIILILNQSSLSMSISVWVRLMLLQELIKVCPHFENDFSKVLIALEGQNWTFSAKEELWASFLRSNHNHIKLKPPLISPEQKTLDLTNLKHVYTLIKNKPNMKKQAWNRTKLSQHLFLYAGQLSEYLYTNKCISNKFHCDLLVDECFGLPKNWKSSSEFITFWGTKRFKLYGEKFWPALCFSD